MTTKEKIIYEALNQFSISGFDAISIRDITNALGIVPSAVYKHFKNKEEILNSIIKECEKRFSDKISSFDLFNSNNFDLNKIILEMFSFQTQDEWICKFRRILIIEQWKNEELYKMYRKYFIDIEVENTKKIIDKLIKEEYLKNMNSKAMAIEFYAPFFMYHTSKEIDDEIVSLLKTHIANFCECYVTKKGE